MYANECNEIRPLIALHLDDELRGDDLLAFQAHIEICDGCRGVLARERRFLNEVRGVAPIYRASEQLRERAIEALGENQPAATAPPGLRRRVRRMLLGDEYGMGWPSCRQTLAVAAAVLLTALGFAFFMSMRTEPAKPPSGLARMAVDTHLRHQRGQLPFEITSESPQEISDWFAGKVPFGVKLPNYQEASGQEKLYRLEGARLVAFRNDYAAYVAYEMKNRPISLVMTSNHVAEPSGGEEIVSHGITFHYDSIEGLKVITWSDRGLTYALVSDLEERGQESCMVCHAGTKDRNFLEKLRGAESTARRDRTWLARLREALK
jgi:anti-sigma factor RsiW